MLVIDVEESSPFREMIKKRLLVQGRVLLRHETLVEPETNIEMFTSKQQWHDNKRVEGNTLNKICVRQSEFFI